MLNGLMKSTLRIFLYRFWHKPILIWHQAPEGSFVAFLSNPVLAVLNRSFNFIGVVAGATASVSRRAESHTGVFSAAFVASMIIAFLDCDGDLVVH